MAGSYVKRPLQAAKRDGGQSVQSAARRCLFVAQGNRTRPATHAARPGAQRSRYLLLTYFSRRMCGTGKPASFSASKQASTMFGLPHR